MENQKLYIGIITLSCLFQFESCIEPYEPILDSNDSVSLLVVEGRITDQPGSFQVKLSRSVPVDVMAFTKPELWADVRISDDSGNVYQLLGDDKGVYMPSVDNLKGEVGRTYTLSVVTGDGLEYESDPVLLREVPDIDNVYFKESVITVFGDEGPYEDYKVSILADSKSYSNEVGYSKWEYEETWEFEMPNIVSVMHGTGEGAPPPTIEQVKVDPERIHCWTSGSTLSMLVASTVKNTENKIQDFEIVSISYPDDKLNIKYSILVKQYAIDRYLYNYFKKLRESNEERGGLYDKTPSQIVGNINCCNSDNVALGYFYASAENQKEFLSTVLSIICLKVPVI